MVRELQQQFERKWLKPIDRINNLIEVANWVNHNNVVYFAIWWVTAHWGDKELDLTDKEVRKALDQVFSDPEYGGKLVNPMEYADTFRKCVEDLVVLKATFDAEDQT